MLRYAIHEPCSILPFLVHLFKFIVIFFGAFGGAFGSAAAPSHLLPDVPFHEQFVDIIVRIDKTILINGSLVNSETSINFLLT